MPLLRIPPGSTRNWFSSSALRWRGLILVISVILSSAMPRLTRSIRNSSPKLPMLIGNRDTFPEKDFHRQDKTYRCLRSKVTRGFCLYFHGGGSHYANVGILKQA